MKLSGIKKYANFTAPSKYGFRKKDCILMG